MTHACRSRAASRLAVAFTLVTLSIAGPGRADEADAAPSRVDYLTFAQGALPLEVSGSAAALGVTMDKAVSAIDGSPSGFVLARKFVPRDADTIFLYELPAATTFDRFAVPNVFETPSPSQTFTRRVEVAGSATSSTSGFAPLAAADLETHTRNDEVTELEILARTPVRWVRVRLIGGNGTQESVPLAEKFSGAWKGPGVQVGLRQGGAAVSGCYDAAGELSGTVSGRILRATGADAGSAQAAR